MRVRVLLADDHNMMRKGLRTLIDKQKGMEVVGEAESGEDVVRMTAELTPDVVVMDIGMPDLNGIDATRRIMREQKNVAVIGLSMHTDRRFIIQMLKAGAAGYIHKDDAFDQLVGGITAVRKGKTYLSPDITDCVVDEFRRISLKEDDDGTAFSTLTDREREVLQQIAEGNSTKETAANLSVSVKTIETHRRQIMEKLDLHSVAELTKYAIREGLTEL